MSEDAAAIDAWWQQVCRGDGLPAGVEPVIGRLIRQVGRGRLPSGPVFVKLMAFPRGKDRLRYAVRALPAEHEARMLARVAAAGIPCPAVLAVRTARRWGLPFRSMLVLRALPVGRDDADAEARLRDCARLACALRDAGLLHPDLNPDNFVVLRDGRRAVLDLQSMRPHRDAAAAGGRMAARLLLEATEVPVDRALEVLIASGLVAPAQQAEVQALARDEILGFLRKRVGRCLQTSTQFERRLTWSGIEHRRRGSWPPGRWVEAGRELVDAWVGQRALEVLEQQPAAFWGVRRKWLWLPGQQSVYIPEHMALDRAKELLRSLAEMRAGHRWLWSRRPDRSLDELRSLRAHHVMEDRR